MVVIEGFTRLLSLLFRLRNISFVPTENWRTRRREKIPHCNATKPKSTRQFGHVKNGGEKKCTNERTKLITKFASSAITRNSKCNRSEPRLAVWPPVFPRFHGPVSQCSRRKRNAAHRQRPTRPLIRSI